jgi:hypothetical protein
LAELARLFWAAKSTVMALNSCKWDEPTPITKVLHMLL